MEKALFPLKYMHITQGIDGSYSHKGTYAIDFGSRGVKENLYAPFTGIIKKIYTHSGNFVWLESKEPVLYADGTVDYMTVLTGHDNDVSSLFVGKEIKQGEIYYHQGNAGNATGIHTHLEVGKGRFTGSGWFKNNYDIWMINNAINPVNALFLTDDVVISKDYGYNFRNGLIDPVNRDTSKDQIEVLINNLRCRKSPSGEVLGLMRPGVYNFTSKEQNGDYMWYQVSNERWIAYSENWAKIYNKEEIKKEPTLEEKYNILLKDYETLKEKNNSYKKIYYSSKEDLYALKLYEGESLYIGKD